MNTYQNIINQTRPVPSRPRMPRQNRAKIFAPYQALKGFGEVIHAKDVVFVHRAELGEYAQERLDRKLRQLCRRDRVPVTWFPATPGEGGQVLGQYVTETGVVERIDPVFRVLLLGKRRIPLEEIIELRGDCTDGE